MNLSDYLSENSISRAEFAERIGVSEVSICRYVMKKRVPRPEQLRRIREATGGAVTANDFMCDSDPEARAPSQAAE